MAFWTNKSVVVTGAGSGIGKALSRALVKRGALVWLSDINGAAASQAAEEIGNGSVGAAVDVTDAAAVKAHVNGVIASHGHLDVLFNNAGIGVAGLAHELDTSHFDRAVAVNIAGVTNGFVAAYAHMANRGSGIIVNTASASGLLGIAGAAPYSMSKHAVVGLTTAARIEGAEYGVQICALCPTAIETPILDSPNPSNTPKIWRPDMRKYLTEIGGPPYPAEKFADYALKQIERNKGIIVAPLGGRLRMTVARHFPNIAYGICHRAYRRAVSRRQM